METKEKLLERNKLIIEEHRKLALFPPIFNSQNDECYVLNPNRYNCYAYAMQMKMPLEPKGSNYWPGFLTKPEMTQEDLLTEEGLTEGFMRDCKALGLMCYEDQYNTNYNSGNNTYKIRIIRYKKGAEFHFTRLDKDRHWSHMSGWGVKPDICYSLPPEYSENRSKVFEKAFVIERW